MSEKKDDKKIETISVVVKSSFTMGEKKYSKGDKISVSKEKADELSWHKFIYAPGEIEKEEQIKKIKEKREKAEQEEIANLGKEKVN